MSFQAERDEFQAPTPPPDKSDLDQLVNPSNTEIPPYTEHTENLPPIEGLPAVYDVLVTSDMQSKGLLPCWGLGKYRKDYDLWEFTEKECKYLGGNFEHLLTFDASGNRVIDANGNTTQIMPLLGSCQRGETYHMEKRSRYLSPTEYYDKYGRSTGGGGGEYVTEDVKVIDKPGIWYTKDCARSAIYGADTRRDVQNYESAEEKKRILAERDYTIRGKLSSCYLLGRINETKDDLIYTKEECDILKGLFDNGKCINPFNKPAPYGGGCVDLDAVKINRTERDKQIGMLLSQKANFKKGGLNLPSVFPAGTEQIWAQLKEYWGVGGQDGDYVTDTRTAETMVRYNLGITDQEIENYKNEHPELVLWTPPPPPLTAEEIAAKKDREMYASAPEFYNKTKKLRQPKKPLTVAMEVDNHDAVAGGRRKRTVYFAVLEPEEEAIIQQLLKETKDETIARGGLKRNFGLWDHGGRYQWEDLTASERAFIDSPYFCELFGEVIYTGSYEGKPWKRCDGALMPAGNNNPSPYAMKIQRMFIQYKGAVAPDGKVGIYGVPGDYSYEFYYKMWILNLFVSETELQEYNTRNGIVVPPSPPEPAPLITPPTLSPLEQAKKDVNDALITPPVIPPPVTVPKTLEEHAEAFEKKVKKFDKQVDDYTYYAIVGGIGLAAYFLVK